MKLQYWRIAGLEIHRGFSVLSIHDALRNLEIVLARYETPEVGIKVAFENHCGVMYCDEFGMDQYIVNYPTNGSQGSSFFQAQDSEFKALLERGDPANSLEDATSYIFVDSDYWIEVLSRTAPSIQIS
jgi:hypothetical protein